MRVISSREVYSNPIFSVAEERAVARDGFEIRRDIVHHRGSAVMLAVDEKSRVLLVRQYRLPARRYLWELPAGRLDEGETPLKTARRELVEETGYRARSWKKLAAFYPSPGYVAEKMTLFLATDLAPGDATPMDDERIQTRWFTRKELDGWLRRGKLLDGKTIAGLLLWLRHPRQPTRDEVPVRGPRTEPQP
jgi:ADP-ribose pyrophosphatase